MPYDASQAAFVDETSHIAATVCMEAGEADVSAAITRLVQQKAVNKVIKLLPPGSAQVCACEFCAEAL